jgi:SAM-dependent methyltransferase
MNMPSGFDPYARSYDDVLADSLGGRGDVERFAAYKIDEMAHRLAGTSVRRILDFGCGVGRSLPFLAEAFPGTEVWGYDPSAECAATARTRQPGACVVDDWSKIDPESFDGVLAANVFHHVPIGVRVDELRRCASALAPGGRLFVFEHNPYNPLTRRVFERCPFDRGASMIAPGEMLELGRNAGLRVQRRAYTLFVPFRGAAAATLHRALAWLPLGAQYYVEFAR